MTVHLNEADLAALGRVRDHAKMRTIIADVARRTDLTVADIKSRDRTARVVLARDLACYIGHERGLTLSQMGRALNRDHSTIASAVAREKARREAADQ